MGIGYNPSLINQRERLDMLGFFNWFRTLQKSGIDVTVWDASSYAIVNCKTFSGTKEYSKLGDTPKAEDIVSWLIQEQEKDFGDLDKFRDNCQLRTKYLNAFAKATDTPVNVVSAWDTFRKDQKRFTECLEQALEFTRSRETNDSEFYKSFISGNEPIKKLYVPLEIAEALYFQATEGIDAKFGPVTEVKFDAAIIDCQNWLGNDYSTLRCPLLKGQDKPAYLRDLSLEGKIITTGMNRKQMARVFRKDSKILQVYEKLLEPMNIEQDCLYSAVKISKAIENIMEGL